MAIHKEIDQQIESIAKKLGLPNQSNRSKEQSLKLECAGSLRQIAVELSLLNDKLADSMRNKPHTGC